MGTVKSRFERNVFDVLMMEHREVEALFERIDALPPDAADAAHDLFVALHDTLIVHAQAEQAVLYPRLAKIDELADAVEGAKLEHETVELVLDELRVLDPGGDAWLARAAVLQQNVRHHIKEEENHVFPTARVHLHDHEAVELATAYLRARLTGQPDPEPQRLREPPRRGIVARIAALFR